MQSVSFLSAGAQQTKKIGAMLAREIVSYYGKERNRSAAIVIGLVGDLGAGKTTFIQGFARGLSVREKITSPTFVIVKEFSLHRHTLDKAPFKNFYHCDFYRLRSKIDLIALTFPRLMRKKENIIVVEWADRIKHFLPKGALKILIEQQGRRGRVIRFFVV